MTALQDVSSVEDPNQMTLEFAAREGAKQGVRDALERATSQQNKSFKMIFPPGWERLQALARKRSPVALRLWLTLAEHAGPEMCLCVRQEDLAEQLNISTKSVQRAVKILEEEGALIVLREFGLPVYCLDPAEMWASWQNAKTWAPFRTRTLLPKGAKESEVFTKRLATMLANKKPGLMPLPARYKSAEEVPDNA